MRFLLIIPALLLFLSNIPFMHRMDMAQAPAPVKKSGCCKKKETRAGTCNMQEEEPPQQKEHSCPKEERKCSKQTESTCVCTCFFHFAAPDQIAARPQFNCNSIQQSLAVYLLHHWKDPHLAVLGQPPDQL